MSAPQAGYEPVRCVAHVHSVHSDGTATVAELRAATRAAGARVLLLTDHDTMAARELGEDGWRDDVLVVVGHEVSPRGGHLLVFGTDDVIPHAGAGEREILDAVAHNGGFGYAAHPFSRGSALSTRIGRPHPWTTFAHPALAGIEVWSLTTDVAESWRTPRAALRALRDPLAVALAGPPERHLEAWDDLAARGHVLAGLGGLDAHAPGLRVGGRVRSIMPHARWMGLVQTVLALPHPLRGDDDADRESVLAALRAGRTAIVVPPLGDPLSAVVAWQGGRLDVRAPPGSVVRVARGGRIALDAPVGDGPWTVGPGAARAEVLRPGPDGRLARWLLPGPRGP